MIQLTETAAKRIEQVKKDENADANSFLRVNVKKGGCSGMSYEMKFDNALTENDKVFETHSQKIVVDKQSYLYLIGMTLDFQGGLNGQGFVFSNPNATKTCGCGSSFNV
ncbi:MAG: heme biosynthesis protein HemY [Proteobacteria bacterium SG_bin7]|nr:MAG: heme biosynthesis protein HemY [Proteobacteria bacterium SG_bin7]